MKNKKEVIIFIIVIVALLVITIGGIAFAYFASNIDSNANLNLDVSTADDMYTFESETNDNIELNINFNEMSEAESYNNVDDWDESIPLKRDTANMNVTLTNPEEGMMTTCTYDIVWVWDSEDRYTEPDVEIPYIQEEDPYIFSWAEFGIMIDNYSDDEVRDLSEFEYDEDRVILKSGSSITVGGKETKTVNHKITAAIYNLPVDQPNLFNKNFKAHIDIENVNCKMESVSTMNTVCSEGGNLGECIKKLGDSKNAYVGDGELVHHNGTFLGLDYTNKNNLYIKDEHSEYKDVDDIIKGSMFHYYLSYDTSFEEYDTIAEAAEQAVKDGYLGIKESSLDANDNGYRYSGNEPNNYICFGAGSEGYNNGLEEKCPITNKYRIIGLVPVTKKDGNIENLVKIIKAEYITAEELGRTNNDGLVDTYNNSNIKYARIEADPSTLDGFHWNDINGSTTKNVWDGGSLYTSLNDDASGYLSFLYGENEANKAKWESMIEDVKWNVGGWNDMFITPKTMYDGEMTDGGRYYSWDTQKQGSGTQVSAKVGLMYAHDYGFAASKDYWNLEFEYDTDIIKQNIWLYNGVMEWTISRVSSLSEEVFHVRVSGHLNDVLEVGIYANGVRPVLYLKHDVNFVKDEGEAGSREKPYKISLS